jgi:hypothetical protein
LVHEILFKASIARKQVRDEQFRDTELLVKETHHQCLLDSVKSAIRHRARRGDAQRLTGQASVTEKLVVAKNAYDRFLALLRGHREFYFPVLKKAHGIRSVSLHEDRAVRAVFENGFPVRDSA